MTRNEVVLLETALNERREELTSPVIESRLFELFVAEKVLRHADLSEEEVEYGLVGGGNDAALDGIFTFLGEDLLEEDDELFDLDTKPSMYPRGRTLSLWLLQAKTEASFTEKAIDLLSSSLTRLLALQPNMESLEALYSADVLARIKIFRDAWRKLATRGVKVSVAVIYATKGNAQEVNAKVQLKARDLEDSLRALVPGGAIGVQFWGARELWTAHNSTPTDVLELAFVEHANYGDSHVALVRLADYRAFLTDEQTGTIRRRIFESNVRDYQGGVEVNREIAHTLQDPEAPDFWWLNNGVTILCSADIKTVNKNYILEDVQIVNGLQTSHTIFEAMKDPLVEDLSSDKTLLVRILASNDPAVRDRVIRATNRQTNVPEASLRATDELQRNIESYFAAEGWYYDRRKNHYRNAGKSAGRIVSIPYLAQAVMAMGLSEPNNSRARPSSLLKRESDYRRVFTNKVSLETYLWLARTQRDVDAYLAAEDSVTGSERTNLRFHLAMLWVARLCGKRIYETSQLNSVSRSGKQLDPAWLPEITLAAKSLAYEFGVQHGFSLDRTAKNAEFVAILLDSMFPKSSQ